MASIKSEYQKARRNLQSKIRGAIKKGYIVPENFLPNIPKKITQGSIRRLEKLSKDFYNKVTYRTSSGDIVSGRAGRAIRRREGAEKQRITKRVNYCKRIRDEVGYEYRFNRYDGLDEYEDYVVDTIEPEPETNIILSEEGIYVDTVTGEEYGELDTIKETPEGTLVDVKTGKTVGTYGDEGEGGLFDETIIDNFLEEMVRAGDAFGQVFNDFIEWSKGEYGEHATSRMIQQAAYTGDLPTHSQRYALESSINFIDTFTNKYLSTDTLWGARADFASHIRALGKYNEYNQMFDQQRANYRNERRAARNARRRNK